MKILFIGDVVGKGGRQALRELVPDLRRKYNCCFCIANGENMAGGGGFTRKAINSLEQAAIDVFTGGDHMWDQRDFIQEIKALPNVIRPANVNPTQPGKGYGIFRIPIGGNIAVISLLGRTFMRYPSQCPFLTADKILAEIKDKTQNIIVDFHAEATSETIAMGRYLDGRVSAVLGTHTHVPTADEQIFPGKTAFQSDVGMVGAKESILGRKIAPVLHRFITGMPARFTVENTGIRLHGTIVEIDANGKAISIQRISKDLN